MLLLRASRVKRAYTGLSSVVGLTGGPTSRVSRRQASGKSDKLLEKRTFLASSRAVLTCLQFPCRIEIEIRCPSEE